MLSHCYLVLSAVAALGLIVAAQQESDFNEINPDGSFSFGWAFSDLIGDPEEYRK